MTEKTGLIPIRRKTRELEHFYYVMQREIKDELLSLDVANYKEIESMKVQERTDRLIKELNRIVYRWAKEAVPMAYDESYIVAKTTLEILGAKKNRYFDSQKHKTSVRLYADTIIDDLLKANMSIKNTINSYLYLARTANAGLMQIQEFGIEDEEMISSIISDAIAEGETRVYASNKIYEYLRLQLLDGQFIDRKGRHYRLKDYSRMVARTRLRETQTKAVKNMCEQYENDLVEWSRHANPCDICAQYEGQIYSLSGNHPKYPLIPEEPPIHPNCEHSISPTSEIAIEAREKFG